jgi:uncharacterized protein YprB with RNaseH-like and TPR domain
MLLQGGHFTLIHSIRRVQKLKDGDLNQCIKLDFETFLNIDVQNKWAVSL